MFIKRDFFKFQKCNANNFLGNPNIFSLLTKQMRRTYHFVWLSSRGARFWSQHCSASRLEISSLHFSPQFRSIRVYISTVSPTLSLARISHRHDPKGRQISPSKKKKLKKINKQLIAIWQPRRLNTFKGTFPTVSKWYTV